jgi:formate hydrogenlyase subunit 3/multisubunit Na+/H+ antiporter MnhD subunit
VTDPTLMVVLPLLGGFLLPLVYRAKPLAGQLFGPAVLLVVGAVGCLAWLRVQSGGPWVVPVGGFAAPIGIVFYVDRLAVLFALLTTLGGLLLWPLGLHDRVREAALTLLLIGGSCGLALSGDLFNLYVFYELVAVASYGLAASSGQPAGHAAAVRFLVLSALGSALALLGIALVYGATGTLNLAQLSALSARALSGPLGLGAFALMMVGFGVKAELFPVNTWVPEVYAAAPARVSGLLAGVVSKLALLILLRLLVLVFAGTQAPLLLLVVGVLGLASGELAAFRSADLRRVLAYSSIGQLGLAAVALAVSGTAGIAAALAVALHHLLVKPALFLLADGWGGPLERLRGAARASPLGAALFVLFALSLVGIPPLPGFWAKFLVMSALIGADAPGYTAAMIVLMVATVVEAAYLFRIVRLLYQRQTPAVSAPGSAALAPALALGSALVLAAFLVMPLSAGLSSVARQVADVSAYVRLVLPPHGAIPVAGQRP